jgi:hypothetical protein
VLVKWYSTTLSPFLSFYLLENIWNADETSLFFRQLMRKSLVFKKENPKGTEIAKERVTVLLAASAGENFCRA